MKSNGHAQYICSKYKHACWSDLWNKVGQLALLLLDYIVPLYHWKICHLVPCMPPIGPGYTCHYQFTIHDHNSALSGVHNGGQSAVTYACMHCGLCVGETIQVVYTCKKYCMRWYSIWWMGRVEERGRGSYVCNGNCDVYIWLQCFVYSCIMRMYINGTVLILALVNVAGVVRYVNGCHCCILYAWIETICTCAWMVPTN